MAAAKNEFESFQVVVDAGHALRGVKVTSGKPLRKQRVPTSQGSFTATLTPPGPGDYLLVARTKADAVNGAGASPPVAVSTS